MKGLDDLVAREPSGPAPLTFQQERYWVVRGQAGWLFGLRLSGAVDIGILSASIAALMRRHEALRSRFVLIEGMPHQVGDPAGDYQLEVMTLDCARKNELEDAIQRFKAETGESWRSIPTSTLFRARLLCLDKDIYVLLIAVEFLVVDEVSFNLLFQELWTLYGQLSRGMCPTLPPLPVQYSDYAVWQRSASLQQLATHKDYWTRRFTGAERIRFPVDHGLSSDPTSAYSSLAVSFPETLSFALQALARKEGTTITMVMLSAFVGAVYSWCRQRDFIVEFIVNGRHRSDLVNVMGHFFQFMPLRIQLSGHETFAELLRLVLQEFTMAYEHVEFGSVARTLPELVEAPSGAMFQWVLGLPARLVGASAPSLRDDARLPFKLERLPISYSLVDGEVNLPEGSLPQPADVALPMWGTSQGIGGTFLYKAHLFRRNTIQRFLRRFRWIAERAVLDPHSAVMAFDDTK
jgi:Condensation domain